MRNFTPTEIDLCKKIAEKERRPINKGDWVTEIDRADIPLLVIDIQLEYLTLSLGYESTHRVLSKRKEVVPLWQEHDCLEFLRRQPNLKMLKLISDYQQLKWFVIMMDGQYKEKTNSGKALLEALLRAVLAVMEEK